MGGFRYFFAYIEWLNFMVHAGKYIYMDPMGFIGCLKRILVSWLILKAHTT